VKRLDTADKVNGKQIYGIDLKFPNMLTATIRDCPVAGGKVKSFDAAKVEGMRGVKKVVPVGDTGVAVVADNFWDAKSALAALPIVWDEGANAKVSSATIAAMLKEGLDAEQAFVGNKAGDAKAALAGAAKVVEAVYSYPYQSHAPMEPMNATALYTPEKCEVWCPTQNAEAALAAVAEAAGLPVAKCDVHKVCSAAGSAGAAAATMSSRPSRSRSSCRAARSSCCGRAKRTRRTISTIRSRNANCAAVSTHPAISWGCRSDSPGNRSWRRCCRRI